MERGELAEFGKKKRNTDDDFLSIEHVGRKLLKNKHDKLIFIRKKSKTFKQERKTIFSSSCFCVGQKRREVIFDLSLRHWFDTNRYATHSEQPTITFDQGDFLCRVLVRTVLILGFHTDSIRKRVLKTLSIDPK